MPMYTSVGAMRYQARPHYGLALAESYGPAPVTSARA